jgi:spore coat protein U-like protein
MNRKLLLSALAAAALAVGNAGAATSPQSANFTVQITIQNSCTITASNVDFGTHADASAQYNEATAGTVGVTCTGKGPIRVGLNAGTNNPVFGSSQMKLGSNFVGYALYSAANGSGLLGDGTGGSNLLFNGTSTGAAQNFTVHGFTDTTGGAVPDGAYTDSVTATVTF